MFSALAAAVPIDPSRNLSAPANEISTDSRYLQHEFQTWQGWYHWADSWTPPQARQAVTFHLKGWPYLSAALARDAPRYPPVMGAIRQRTAAPLRTSFAVEGPDRAPGRFAVEDLQDIFDEQFRPSYDEKLRDLAFLGGHVIHQHWELDAKRGLEVPRLKRWPHEAIVWQGASPGRPGGWYAITADSGMVRIVPGDGHWIVLGHGERWHEMGAIVALGLTFVGGELARRDEAGLSEAAGRSAPVAELPDKVKVNDEQGRAVQAAMIDLGRARKGIVVPNGTKITPFSIASDTDFFEKNLQGMLQHVSFAILGQSGTMVQGAGGVYLSPTFAGTLRALNDGDIEATLRGWDRGVAKPYCEINGINAVTHLAAITPKDPDASATETAKRAQALGATVKAWLDAGLEPTQGDVDALAKELGTATVKLGKRKEPPKGEAAT